MRGRAPTGWRSVGRVLLRAAAWCAMLFALLTCTPPDFTPQPTGDPLTIAPLEPEVTAGMSFTFTAAGGAPPYTYGVSGGGSITSTGKYTAPAYPDTVTVHVTDNAHDTASTDVIVRASQLWIVPADVTIPANTSITFQGQGGTPPYTYTVIGGLGGFGTLPETRNVYTSPPSATMATIQVRDAASFTETTFVTVEAPLDPLLINPATAVVETGVQITFSASGGNPTYKFGIVSGKGTIDVDSGLYSSDESGTATVKVTDSNGTGDTVTASVTINNPPPPLTITPTSATVIVGGTQTFTAAGGTSPYSFTLESGDPGYLSGTGSSRLYHAEGSGFATLTVTDSRSRTASAPINITNVLGITPSSTSIEVLGTVMLVASGGDGTYEHWTVTGGGSVPLSSSGPTVIYTAPSSPVIATVTVDDSVTTADCIITVTPGPLTISPATITLQVGNTVFFSADGGVSYTFEVLPGGVGTIGLISGEYNAGSVEGPAIVRVTDNYDRTQDAAVTVNPPPLTLSPASISIQSGSSVTFTADGGTLPYAFTKVSGVGSIDGITGVYTSSAEGAATVKVTDGEGRTDTSSVTVEPPPAPPLNLSPVNVNVQTGSDQTFSASGGSGDYAWSATAGSITSSGVYTAPASVSPSPTAYTVRVDSGGDYRLATVNVYMPLVISPNPATIDAGATKDFSASGGIKPFTFTLPTGLGTITPIDEYTVHYTAPGAIGVETLRVTDSQGKFTEWTFNIVDPALWGTRQTIDGSKKSGQFAALALGPATSPQPGAPQIAYWEAQGKDLKLAKWTGSSWNLSTIDSNNSGDKYASLALDADGHAKVAWYDANTHELKYRAWTGSSWIPELTVDTDGDVGQFASLALDTSENPHIAYYDASGALKYTAWNGTSWDLPTTVDTGSVGQYASLALDGSGNPRIAYYDASGSLKYAAWNVSAWTIETVDSGSVGQFASLKLDTIGQPSIAYYDAGGKNLKLAAYHTGTWDIETVDSTGDVGQYASLALDSSNQYPHVAYWDATNGNLRYAAWNGFVWVIATVDGSANNVGQYASLALDPDRLMRIAYYNATTQDLLYIAEQPHP